MCSHTRQLIRLNPWPERIMPEGVARADLAVSAMHEEFALLSAGYITSPFGRLGLGIVDRGRALAASRRDRDATDIEPAQMIREAVVGACCEHADRLQGSRAKPFGRLKPKRRALRGATADAVDAR